MTNAQMDVLTKKLSSIEERLIRVEAVQKEQTMVLNKIAEDKSDIASLKSEVEQLDLLVKSIEDEVEA